MPPHIIGSVGGIFSIDSTNVVYMSVLKVVLAGEVYVHQSEIAISSEPKACNPFSIFSICALRGFDFRCK